MMCHLIKMGPRFVDKKGWWRRLLSMFPNPVAPAVRILSTMESGFLLFGREDPVNVISPSTSKCGYGGSCHKRFHEKSCSHTSKIDLRYLFSGWISLQTSEISEEATAIWLRYPVSKRLPVHSRLIILILGSIVCNGIYYSTSSVIQIVEARCTWI